jgi:hypothetical protein
VDTDGKSHKVLHRGVAFKDKESSFAPSTIPPTAALEDLILPTDYVQWSNAEGGYRTLELLPQFCRREYVYRENDISFHAYRSEWKREELPIFVRS